MWCLHVTLWDEPRIYASVTLVIQRARSIRSIVAFRHKAKKKKNIYIYIYNIVEQQYEMRETIHWLF